MTCVIRTMLVALAAGQALACGSAPAAPARSQRPAREIDRVLERTLAPPTITTAPGFSATIVVPPGGMHDTMMVLPHDGVLWINDDGGAASPGLDRGGFVWSLDPRSGRVSRLVDPSRMLPSTGMDVAPQGFGSLGGHLVTLATPTVLRVGVSQNHVIQHIDPRGDADAVTLCTLPNHGTSRGGVAGGGTESRFGPPGSGFANKFFATTIFNDTVYQVTGDGQCRPFVTIPNGSAWGMAFTPDGSKMLLVVKPRSRGATGPAARSAIVAVSPDGTIDPTPVYEHPDANMFDVDVAPPDFGQYAGQIFFTHRGANESRGGSIPPLGDGSLYHIAADGTARVVASGMFNPGGFAFVDRSIWIGDRSRDGPFMGGTWLPDAYVVRIDVDLSR